MLKLTDSKSFEWKRKGQRRRNEMRSMLKKELIKLPSFSELYFKKRKNNLKR
jgi:hypothetical protein